MKEIEIVVEEVYSVIRTINIKMDDKQYRDYINGDNPIDGLMKKSKSVNEFVNMVRSKKCVNSIKATDLRNDMKHKDLKYFDIDYGIRRNRGKKRYDI